MRNYVTSQIECFPALSFAFDEEFQSLLSNSREMIGEPIAEGFCEQPRRLKVSKVFERNFFSLCHAICLRLPELLG